MITLFDEHVHDLGARRKLVATVTDDTDALADPSVMTFTMREPDDVRTTYVLNTNPELVRESLGVFYVYWDCAKVGRHRWRFAASGTIGAAEEASFVVRPSTVLPG